MQIILQRYEQNSKLINFYYKFTISITISITFSISITFIITIHNHKS